MQSYALIADADITTAAVYAHAVRDEGMTYISVRDASRALAVLTERGTPDVFVTEITLPDLDGFELVERVRRAPGGTSTAVIMISADRELRERAALVRAQLDLGAVLSKAATVDSIRRVLRRLRDPREIPPARPRTESPLPPSAERPVSAAVGGRAPPDTPWSSELERRLLRRGHG